MPSLAKIYHNGAPNGHLRRRGSIRQHSQSNQRGKDREKQPSSRSANRSRQSAGHRGPVISMFMSIGRAMAGFDGPTTLRMRHSLAVVWPRVRFVVTITPTTTNSCLLGVVRLPTPKFALWQQ